MSFYPIKNLTPEEKDKLQNDFDVFFATAEGRDKMWGELKTGIQNLSHEEMYSFYDTYTKWFSVLAWKKFSSLPFDDALFCLNRVLFFGAVQNQDMWQSVIDYLGLHAIDEDDMSNKYQQIKDVIFNSREVIRINTDKTIYRIADLITDFKKINYNKDDLFLANVLSNLDDFIKDRLKLLGLNTEGTDNMVAILKSLIDFLLGVEKNNIWDMLESINYPQEYENLFGNSDGQKIDDSTILFDDPNLEKVDKFIDEIVEEKTSTETSSIGSIIQPPEKSSTNYQTIKSQLEQQFSYDEVGELQPLEEVLARLSQLAEENNDEKIEELYMFDENKGKFVWNEELLS
ncbi:MAG: hypothetical protein CO029_00245 [Candidatus Magasanikbacteria bacterium CG_4_9_14_0_2_um_filter_41_10]|nr:MAG: hypothetical protein CO029_00245 [Candidatus Magasanikbacteria bacterium CG_4_9_14_0_2_um_filter_41_10]